MRHDKNKNKLTQPRHIYEESPSLNVWVKKDRSTEKYERRANQKLRNLMKEEDIV